MPTSDAAELRAILRRSGLSDRIIEAAWPSWWTDEAEISASAQTELRLSLARKLGLDPSALLESDTPKFIWRDAGRFKHLTAEEPGEREVLSSFARSLANIAVSGVPNPISIGGESALRLRSAARQSKSEFVRLIDLLSLCWSIGVPVIHLRVFPLPQKRMAAMTARVATRSAVFLAKDSMYPAHIAFYLAHEIGHIAMGHVADGGVLVDFEPDSTDVTDPEEQAADAFALEMLTGRTDPQVLPTQERYTARELARVALAAGPQLGIEPGTLALCFGYATGDWATANGAMPHIYDAPRPVWQFVNQVAADEFMKNEMPSDGLQYVLSLMGDFK